MIIREMNEIKRRLRHHPPGVNHPVDYRLPSNATSSCDSCNGILDQRPLEGEPKVCRLDNGYAI
ncbi:hypothetical protein DPMN_058550 [Dreissena polymorpha]|uniref:Uncharacterized protein n=1 Tax=Dreissena polymorpha TaxID=45954 RepID=A0A9D4C2B3_DREPO|nr:hypothetical protein DPMN_058550 [Dreissena polymorpha]